ncbi:MAG: nucleoside kinase [Tannerellaceae bacterium]|jgi:uridine kinase|nr:nucleoside kinase [Tannerellaceae bacterium]
MLADVYKAVGEPCAGKVLAAVVDGRCVQLTFRCWESVDVEFVDYRHPEGARVYVRSLLHLLAKCIDDFFPRASMKVEHSISRGYYCVVDGHGWGGADDVEIIKWRMDAIVKKDLPFVRVRARSEEAADIFWARRMADKAKLIDSAGLGYTVFYDLGGYVDCFYGCEAMSSGDIDVYDITPFKEGILLRAPAPDKPGELETPVVQEKMYDVYKESLALGLNLGLSNVGDLNMAVAGGGAAEVILVAEAMQEKQIAHIADDIAGRMAGGVRLALISGPSSSGKTTFANRLGIQLLTNGVRPVTISMDDYFLNRHETPRDKDGEYDFESLYALDLELFNGDLAKLFGGEEVHIPSYNFTTGMRVYQGRRLRLSDNALLVVEGIHALNPELTAGIDKGSKYGVYVSALTSISLDNHNRIPTTDNRLLRRIIRDARFRAYPAGETIERWPSVRRGEDQWIFPFQETADAMFNSAMLYELAALRPYAEPLLEGVRETDSAYREARRLAHFLKYFNPIPSYMLPPSSLLREFVGMAGSDNRHAL